MRKALKTGRFRGSFICRYLPSNSAKFGFYHLTRNQVIPNGTEGSNPSLSAKNKGYSVCYTLYSFVDKTARDSNKNGRLCRWKQSGGLFESPWLKSEAMRRSTAVRRKIPHSPPKKQDIAKAMSCFLHFRCVWTSRNKSGRVYRVRLSVKCIWFPLSFLKAAAVDKTKKAM